MYLFKSQDFWQNSRFSKSAVNHDPKPTKNMTNMSVGGAHGILSLAGLLGIK